MNRILLLLCVGLLFGSQPLLADDESPHDVTWSLTHRAAALGQSNNCTDCHEQDFCLQCHSDGRADEMGQLGNRMINVHRSEFSVTHPLAARTDQGLCSKCHENKFCVECHEAFNPADLTLQSHRKGWSDLQTSSTGLAHKFYNDQQCQTCHIDSVLPSHDWSNQHAREARKNLATCQSCHPDGDVCVKCHSARSGLGANPHPKDWKDMAGRLKRASDGRTCRKCH